MAFLHRMANDGSQASHQAVAELKAEGVSPAQTVVRTNKYLNNMIEQNHRELSASLRKSCGGRKWDSDQVGGLARHK
jgi:transposase-like protein